MYVSRTSAGIIKHALGIKANLKNNFQPNKNLIYPQTNLIWNSNPIVTTGCILLVVQWFSRSHPHTKANIWDPCQPNEPSQPNNKPDETTKKLTLATRGDKNCPCKGTSTPLPYLHRKVQFLVTKTAPARERRHLFPSFIEKCNCWWQKLPLQGNVDTASLLVYRKV